MLSMYSILTVLFVPFTHAVVDNQHQNLALFQHNGASVLPITEINGIRYMILGKEVRGYWDDFCGKADAGENHCIKTAAREFMEEGLLEEVLGWDAQKTEDYISLNSENTEVVVCTSGGFSTFITSFDWTDLARNWFVSFHDKIQDTTLPRCKREKVTLCLVPFDECMDKIQKRKKGTNVFVKGFFYDEKTQKMKYFRSVWLRPFLVTKLFHYASDTIPVCTSDNDKVLFYS